MSIGQRIKTRREALGITQDELALKMGYKSRSTIAKIEIGINDISQSKIQQFANVLSTTPSFLLGLDENIPHKKGACINVLGSVPAGIPIEAVEDIVDTEEISEDMLKGGAEYFGLKVKGNSMYPKYIEGDTIIVKKQDDCESGQDAVVYVNGYDATLKKVIKNESNIILQPLNPEYDVKVYDYTGEDGCPVKIAGIVVELRRKI